ncbi:MAG: hypothetical protein A3A57_00045 [Candidatus Woykebacteria bacterium RIFCSPLOWO2_01_FULL_41_12]|uniref:LTD domain-containing protein n=1 Tax=Candidatus Woykebacteria bacterium RIFCSPLOWO2_01_FULL_41_12 TaxID=1802604 RepID=A0A1G1WYL4_9BACT|nr:MAG: hypothetical protein A3A57_00045 [Candidatus Woykebacteria bacterium RIFCSPLOWO2_01_FULL_41_12]
MIIAILVLLFLLTPKEVQAIQTGIVLNEIFAPTVSDWVEIYNKTDSEINVSEWKIEDTATTPIKVFSSGTIIGPRGFLVVEVASRLNNSGDIIRLVTKDGNEIDIFEYTAIVPNKSFARLPDGSDIWTEADPTKNVSNGEGPPKQNLIQKTGFITLSEFMPSPAGGSEWAEVYNPNTFELNISGWKIDDIDGGSSPFTIPTDTKINAKSYKVFSFSSKLNNSGDSIRLLNPSGSLAEKYDFSDTQKGLSFAKDTKGAWQLTTSPTPGSVNKITFAQGALGISLGTDDPTNPRNTLFGVEGENTNKPTLSNQTIRNYIKGPSSNGKVAGIAKLVNENNKLSTLAIAAGVSFILTALVWPILENKLWKK